MVLSRVRLIRVKLVLVNLNPINDTYITKREYLCCVAHRFKMRLEMVIGMQNEILDGRYRSLFKWLL